MAATGGASGGAVAVSGNGVFCGTGSSQCESCSKIVSDGKFYKNDISNAKN